MHSLKKITLCRLKINDSMKYFMFIAKWSIEKTKILIIKLNDDKT